MRIVTIHQKTIKRLIRWKDAKEDAFNEIKNTPKKCGQWDKIKEKLLNKLFPERRDFC